LEAGSAFRVPTFPNYFFGEPSSGFTPGLGSASKVEAEQKIKVFIKKLQDENEELKGSKSQLKSQEEELHDFK
jgi:hypothetical protein